jgi:type IV pilus assembly protein PilB
MSDSDPSFQDSPGAPDQKLGDRLVQEGYLTPEQRDEVLREQQTRTNTPFGQICLELGYLVPEQLEHLLTQWGMRLPIGEVLLREGLIQREHIERAAAIQQRKGGDIGEILIGFGAISERELYEVLARQYHLPLLRLGALEPDPNLRSIINPAYAAQNLIVPAFKFERTLTVAMADPSRVSCTEDLRRATGLEIVPVVALASEVRAFYRDLYLTAPAQEFRPHTRSGGRAEARRPIRQGEETHAGRGRVPAATSREIPVESDEASERGSGLTLEPEPEVDLEVVDEEEFDFRKSQYLVELKDSPVVQNLVHTIISRALALGASDIHLESDVSGPRLRFRVDGLLTERPIGGNQDELLRMNYRSVISRFKILSRMDISEKRRPQDASFRMVTRRGHSLATVDFRLSTIPGRFGEGMVIRLLDELRSPASLESLGFRPELRESLRTLISRPMGILLITGPTGSGKSSTLYAALRTLYRPEIKIVTVEDPIEFTHPGIVQAEVNPVIGNTFARFLRAFLRHDPDVVMVGEIRDEETAEIALRAAQTGHLLLSTLHTSSATSSVRRLLDLHDDPNSLAQVLIGVMAQRLVRLICPRCRESYRPDRSVLEEWFEGPPPDVDWQHGAGCGECDNTGYKGRAALAELWVPQAHEITLINRRASSEELRAEALKRMPSLGEDALLRAVEGQTTLDEVLRVVPYEDVQHVKARGSRLLAEEGEVRQGTEEDDLPMAA